MDPDLIQALKDASVFPGDHRDVEIRQTHMSVVCLTGDLAYKFKKGVRLPFADFSTLEKRKFFCEEEIRLNRRLCPDTYLGVVPLRRAPSGRLSVGGPDDGEVIDYAVRMRRLPQDRMLDEALEADSAAVTAGDMEAIAERMAAFHRRAERSDVVSAAGDPAKLREFARANFRETRKFAGSLFDGNLHASLEERTRKDFARWLPELKARAGQGRVVEGHGDLHARNICMIDPVAIFDCIEFEPAFRCGDVATENAFLVMDLKYRRRPDLAEAYLNRYQRLAADPGQADLMPMLVRYRAMVRAKVAAIASAERELSDDEHAGAVQSARTHLALAAVSAIEEDGPWWIVATGLPGAGKSHLFEALARETGWPLLGSDRIRKDLAGAAPGDSLPEGCYSGEFSGRTYRELFRRAGELTGRSPVVLLDASFRSRGRRAEARDAAKNSGARTACVSVETAEPVALERLRRRERRGDSESDAGVGVYRRLAREFEPPSLAGFDRFIRAAGERPAEESVPAVLSALLD